MTQSSPPHAAALRAALDRAPDPEHAARQAEKLLAALEPPVLEAADPAAVGRVLRGVGVAPFLVGHLARHPEALVALLADDLAAPLEREPLARELAALEGTDPEEAARRLRLCKYRCLARICARDASDLPLARSGETLAELSLLADVLLEGALRVAHARVCERLGPPLWRDAAGAEHEAGFCVLGLGKLGSEELNFSSDVDLIYVHEAVPEALSGPQEQTPAAWFTRLAQELGRLVGDLGVEGFLYRVDLDLRPRGTSGPLVLSDAQLLHYYETAAETWEQVAFMKARPVAGDLALGWRTVRAVHPLIYSQTMDYDAVRRIRALKEKIGEARGATGEEFDVKLDAGGIRDVEFVAQSMQLLHGGRIPQLRGRSTQRTLRALGEVEVLPEATVVRLLHAYRFLRRVENRLQMEDERQVHRVPEPGPARTRLARALGFLGEDAPEAFDAALGAARGAVLAVVGDHVADDYRNAVLDLFARHASGLLGMPSARRMMETLAGQLARAIDASIDPDRAMNNLDRFVEGQGGRRFYYELLLDRPELVPRLVTLFASSRFLSSILARHPQWIEPVFAVPERLLLSRDELRGELAEIRAELGGPDTAEFERDLDTLRLFYHRQVVNVGLLDLDGKIERAAVEGALTEVAEVILEAALAVAAREQAARGDATEAIRATPFAVIGMGKLASRELGYGSDLDLIFLYDPGDADPADIPEAQDHFARLAQRLITVLQTPTAEGFCYEIDPRLRPSGRQGSLVTSLAAFRRYHEKEAAVWERQILLRARPLVGDATLGASFDALRREILARPLPVDAAAEIRRIRARMETELAAETPLRHDLKAGRGGLLDVENAAQYLRLRHGGARPELLDVMRVEVALERLEAAGLLAAPPARALREGYDFLQRLSSRLRVVENRSISELDEERGDLDGLALRLGYPPGEREGTARSALLRDYARHTQAIRQAYERVLGGDAG